MDVSRGTEILVDFSRQNLTLPDVVHPPIGEECFLVSDVVLNVTSEILHEFGGFCTVSQVQEEREGYCMSYCISKVF